MFSGTDMGAAFLEAVDALVNSAMPPDALAASGGARSWKPSFTDMSQFNSSVTATQALITTSTKAGPLGMSATNESTLTTLGMVLRKKWTNITGIIALTRRRRLAASQQQHHRLLQTTTTSTTTIFGNITCISSPSAEKNDVVALSVSFIPPPDLVAVLGLNAPSEIATLINDAIATYSPSMNAFSSLVEICTGSNLTLVLSGGKSQEVLVVAAPISIFSSTPSVVDLIPYAAGFGSLAAVCCCCVILVFFCKRRRRRLLVLFDNNAVGGRLAAVAARALVSEASFSDSTLYRWRIDMAPLCYDDDAMLKPVDSDHVSALRAAADAIVVILAPIDKQQMSCSPFMCTAMVVGGSEAHCANTPSDARHARDTPKESTHLVCASLLPQDAETALVRLSSSSASSDTTQQQQQQETRAESNALHKWVECVFTDAIAKIITPTSFSDSSDWHYGISKGQEVLTLIAELMPPPMRTLIFVSDSLTLMPPSSSTTISSDVTRTGSGTGTADSIFSTLRGETKEGGILSGWNVIASPLMPPPATRDVTLRARADADLVLFYVAGGNDTFVEDSGSKTRVPQPVRLHPLSIASLGATNAASLLEDDAALLVLSTPLRVASMSLLSKVGVSQSWAANYVAPLLPPLGQRAVLLATIAPSLLLLHVPGTPYGPARTVARALRYEAVTVGGSLVHWYVRSLAAADASAVDKAAADVIIFLVEHKDALQAAASERMTLHSIEGMNARRLTDDIKTDDMNATALVRDQPFSKLLGTAVLLASEDKDNGDNDHVPASDRAWVKTHIISRLPRARVGQSLTLIADFSALPATLPPQTIPPVMPPPIPQVPSPSMPSTRIPWGLSMWKPRNREKGRFPREDAHVVSLVASRRPSGIFPAPGQLNWGGVASPVALDATGAHIPHPLRTRSRRSVLEINSDTYKLSKLYSDNKEAVVKDEAKLSLRAPVPVSKQKVLREVTL